MTDDEVLDEMRKAQRILDAAVVARMADEANKRSSWIFMNLIRSWNDITARIENSEDHLASIH